MTTGRITDAQRRLLLVGAGVAPGDVIAGLYTLDERLGEGGAGEVFRARDRATGAVVALKVLAPDAATRPGEQLEADLGRLRRLDHPGLVCTLDAGEHGGRRFVVTEFVDGESLQERLRRAGPLDAATARTLGAAILRALEYAHGNGVVHRDVKPSNVMLAAEGPRLVDFGLSRRLGIPSATGGDVWGTAEYLAPEIVDGREEDHRVDVYSVSATLYEAIAGRPPFRGETPAATARARLGRGLILEPALLQRADARLVSVLVRGLALDPSARYPTARAMREAIEAPAANGLAARGELRRLLRRDAEMVQGSVAVRRAARSRVIAWTAPALVATVGLAAWAWRAGGAPASAAIVAGRVRVKNPFGRTIATIDAGAPVRAAALLHDRGERPTAFLIRSAGVDGWRFEGGSWVPAFRVDSSTFGPSAPAFEPESMTRVEAPGGRSCVLTVWRSPTETGALVLAPDGQVLGAWRGAGSSQQVAYDPDRRVVRAGALLLDALTLAARAAAP